MGVSAFEVALGLGVLLAGLEVIAGSFVFLSFSLGCFVVAGVEFVSGQFVLGRDVAVFAVIGVLAVVGLRMGFYRAGDSRRAEGDVNDY